MADNRFDPELELELGIWAAENATERIKRIPAWLGDAISSIWRQYKDMRYRMEKAEELVDIIPREHAWEHHPLTVGGWDRVRICRNRDIVWLHIEDMRISIRLVLKDNVDSRKATKDDVHCIEVMNEASTRYKMVVAPRAANVFRIERIPD